MSGNMGTDCSRLRGPEWVTTTQAWRLLGISREALFRAMNTGDLEFSTTPGGWRKMRRVDVEAYRELLDKQLGMVPD